jgi:hypothetical protein
LQEVGRGYQVNGGSHQTGPHRATFDHQGGQLIGSEVHDPCPQPNVRCERCLRLHADQVLQYPLRAVIRAFEQQLPGQRRAIQLPRRQPIDHPNIVPGSFLRRYA